jgi:hypothetical protein
LDHFSKLSGSFQVAVVYFADVNASERTNEAIQTMWGGTQIDPNHTSRRKKATPKDGFLDSNCWMTITLTN